MDLLDNLSDEELENRWKELYPSYVELVDQLKEVAKDLEKKRKELSLIQNQLVKRKIQVDGI